VSEASRRKPPLVLQHTSTWTASEDRLIIAAVCRHGNFWTVIANMLPGRTGSAVENHWNTHLAKLVGFDEEPAPTKFCSDDFDGLWAESRAESDGVDAPEVASNDRTTLTSIDDHDCTSKKRQTCQVIASLPCEKRCEYAEESSMDAEQEIKSEGEHKERTGKGQWVGIGKPCK
jgi:hypothetical protein